MKFTNRPASALDMSGQPYNVSTPVYTVDDIMGQIKALGLAAADPDSKTKSESAWVRGLPMMAMPGAFDYEAEANRTGQALRDLNQSGADAYRKHQQGGGYGGGVLNDRYSRPWGQDAGNNQPAWLQQRIKDFGYSPEQLSAFGMPEDQQKNLLRQFTMSDMPGMRQLQSAAYNPVANLPGNLPRSIGGLGGLGGMANEPQKPTMTPPNDGFMASGSGYRDGNSIVQHQPGSLGTLGGMPGGISPTGPSYSPDQLDALRKGGGGGYQMGNQTIPQVGVGQGGGAPSNSNPLSNLRYDPTFMDSFGGTAGAKASWGGPWSNTNAWGASR